MARLRLPELADLCSARHWHRRDDAPQIIGDMRGCTLRTACGSVTLRARHSYEIVGHALALCSVRLPYASGRSFELCWAGAAFRVGWRSGGDGRRVAGVALM